MTYRGHIHNGVVVLDEPVTLPEGAKVEVNVVVTGEEASKKPRRLIDLAGIIESGLPTDLALNHDHYLHGQPKK
jgi:predicted DNA-binding antitoxin AbrB/MazE fold protein